MNLKNCYNFSDFRKLAKKNLPSPIFHYIDGGADEWWVVRFNEVDSPLWRWRVEITRNRRRRSEYRGGDEEDDTINLYQYQWQRSVVVTRRGVGAVGCVVLWCCMCLKAALCLNSGMVAESGHSSLPEKCLSDLHAFVIILPLFQCRTSPTDQYQTKQPWW